MQNDAYIRDSNSITLSPLNCIYTLTFKLYHFKSVLDAFTNRPQMFDTDISDIFLHPLFIDSPKAGSYNTVCYSKTNVHLAKTLFKFVDFNFTVFCQLIFKRWHQSVASRVLYSKIIPRS